MGGGGVGVGGVGGVVGLRVLGETSGTIKSGTIKPKRSLLLDLIARCYSELTQTYRLT